MNTTILYRQPVARLNAFMYCMALGALSCTPNGSGSGTVSIPLAQGLSLEEACAFHRKCGMIVGLEDKVGLFYKGASLFRIGSGPRPRIADYNLWETGYFVPNQEKSDSGERIPYAEELPSDNQDQFRYIRLFTFRVEASVNEGENRIPIHMGQYSFDVVVEQMESVKGIDETLPGFGMSIRQFIKRIEQPSPFDEQLDIRSP